ncbi:MAG: ATP-dependent DNA helicase RecG [Candidatus Omnitrophica bacterium]|nr:ATP-dependent DNA helicase RecG [Candidatus Omnitrophota bacterium]
MPVAQSSLRERSIRYIKGVGPHRLSQLAQLGVETVEDACYYAPRRYEDRTHLLAIGDARPGELVTVRGRVRAKTLRRIRRGQTIFEAAVEDASGVLHAVWFNQPYLAQQLLVGQELLLYGQIEARPRRQIVHPELERVEPDETDVIHVGRIVPVYPLAAGLSQRWFRQVIWIVLEQHAEGVEELLPEALRASRGLPPAAQAIRDLHFPASWEAQSLAQRRLAFEELFLFQLALAQRRSRTQTQRKPQRYQPDGPLTQALRRRLPFTLTPSQERVLEELSADMLQASPMHRLLQGDVGCGKTVVMMSLIAMAVQSGYQVALMAPTELLAEQHARVMRSYLEPLGVSLVLLSQGVPAAERRRLTAEIAAGRAAVVLGTHALLQTSVTFPRLALAIIDEQHKFGVVQRAHLARKAERPDVLVVTATPIPRTLALSLYGDLDISTITELPAGRRPITTRWLRESQRSELYAMIREQLARGRQGYVVYPLVQERAAKDVKAATQMAKQLQAEVFPEFRIGLLHGQMKPKTKEQTMLAFARGELHLLVSTVIVEVGLDVPNAAVMVIEHPERFGLAQLHQMRGRIGRGEHPASCLVVSDAAEEGVRQRLRAFVETTDGFQLAEKDLQQRGPGELLGRRQHGWLRFRIANLARDHALLEEARDDATELISRDPELRDPALAALRSRLALIRQQAS